MLFRVFTSASFRSLFWGLLPSVTSLTAKTSSIGVDSTVGPGHSSSFLFLSFMTSIVVSLNFPVYFGVSGWMTKHLPIIMQLHKLLLWTSEFISLLPLCISSSVMINELIPEEAWKPQRSPYCLKELITPYHRNRPLHSHSAGLLVVPKTSDSWMGGRGGGFMEPNLKSTDGANSICTFKMSSKVFLFVKACSQSLFSYSPYSSPSSYHS